VLPQVRNAWKLTERRACAILDVNRKMLHYRLVKRDDPVLRRRIKEIAVNRIRYGYNRITVLLRREGWLVNVKRVRRIYREENLMIRTKAPKRRRAASVRTERTVATAPNQSWAMDFMHDLLADGSKILFLTIVDIFSRESLALEVDFHFNPRKSSRFCAGLWPSAVSLISSVATTVRNLYLCNSTSGRTGRKLHSTSHGLDIRQTNVGAGIR